MFALPQTTVEKHMFHVTQFFWRSSWISYQVHVCSSRSRLVFTFLVPAHPGSRRQRAVKWLYVHIRGQYGI